MKVALEILLDKLSGIQFAVIGTYNMQIQGIDIAAHDLDILTDDKGVEEIASIFGSNITKNNKYKETGFVINKTDVHVVSNINNQLRTKDFEKEIVFVNMFGTKVPCMSLTSELKFYSHTGRDKDKGKPDLIKKRTEELNNMIKT